MRAFVHSKASKVDLRFVLCLGIGGRIPHGFCTGNVRGNARSQLQSLRGNKKMSNLAL